MFNSKTKQGDAALAGSSTTIIGAGTIINGDINSNGDIRIDGTLIGNLHSKSKIIIGQDAVVEGDINGQQADIMGKVTGTVKIKELLQLRGKCNVNGELFAGRLEVEPTATFNGSCHMGANIVELSPELSNVANL